MKKRAKIWGESSYAEKGKIINLTELMKIAKETPGVVGNSVSSLGVMLTTAIFPSEQWPLLRPIQAAT